MRVMRAEPSRFADMTTKSVGAVWRAYDLQLTTYAALLGAVGLVMAYTNSVEAGQASVLANGTGVVSTPWSQTSPSPAARIPLISLINVVLPAPFGPISPIISPL